MDEFPHPKRPSPGAFGFLRPVTFTAHVDIVSGCGVSWTSLRYQARDEPNAALGRRLGDVLPVDLKAFLDGEAFQVAANHVLEAVEGFGAVGFDAQV